MKALSVKQPWAGLIAMNLKSIETRTWQTKYRGRILICAGKSVAVKMDDISLLKVRGKALCTVNLVDVRPYTKKDTEQSYCDWYSNAYSWVFEDVKSIKHFDVKGMLGLFEVDYEED